MPKIVYTIAYENDMSSLNQEAKKAKSTMDKAFQGSSSNANRSTQATKEQEEALKGLREELRRRISLVDAQMRLGEITQQQAEERIQTIRKEMDAQGAFNENYLKGAQNLKTFANAQNRAQSGFKGMSPTINRANQVLFDLNQGLQDVPFGMRGIGNNIPFVIEGFRRFGQTARQEGINPLKGFLQAMVSPSGLIGTAAAVIPTILTLTAQWDQFLSAWGLGQETTEKNTEAFKEFNDVIEETADRIPGLQQVDILSDVNEDVVRRIELTEQLNKTQLELTKNRTEGLRRQIGASRQNSLVLQQNISLTEQQLTQQEQRERELANAIENTNEELSEQGRFIQQLSEEERKELKDNIDTLKDEARNRENVQEYLELNLTARQQELRVLEETTDNVLDNYLLKIGDKAPEALQKHRDRLIELSDEQRNNADAIKNHLTTLEEGTEAYEHTSEQLDVYRQRLKDTEDQLDRVNEQLDKLKRPDVDLTLPEEEILEDDIPEVEQLDQWLNKQNERRRKRAQMRRKFARQELQTERKITQQRLAAQVVFTERRRQIEQDLSNDINRINTTLGITEIEREEMIFQARKDYMQRTLQLERNVAQQRKQLDQEVSQAKVQAQQQALNALTSLSQAFAEDNKAIATGILAIEKGLAIAQAAKEGAQRAGQAQMIASYYWSQAMTPVGPNPAAISAALNAEKQVAAIGGTTAATIAAITATGIGEAASIALRDNRTSGTNLGGSAGGVQEGFNTTNLSPQPENPTNFAQGGEQKEININVTNKIDRKGAALFIREGEKEIKSDLIGV